MKKAILSGLACALLMSKLVFAQDVRNERIQISQDTMHAVVDDTITGYESVNYLVSANTGQSLIVNLDSDNLGSYFNLFAPGKIPGEDRAMFIGSTEGNQFEESYLTDGDYTIQVYIIRSMARRNETANYTLTLRVANSEETGATK
jgi:hypothetical protein